MWTPFTIFPVLVLRHDKRATCSRPQNREGCQPDNRQLLDTVKFALTVRNLGPDPALGVLVTDKMSSDLELLGAMASHGVYNPVLGLWNVGYLPVGGVTTLEIITAVIGSNETIDNMANVSSSIYDPDLSNTRLILQLMYLQQLILRSSNL